MLWLVLICSRSEFIANMLFAAHPCVPRYSTRARKKSTLTVITMTTTSETSPLLQALSAHQVRASVVDFDHYRVHGGISVETDYIISVHPDEKAGDSFDSFK